MKLLIAFWMVIAQIIAGFTALFAPPAVLPEVVSHRGANGYAPENTLPAFEKSIALGANSVETDVIETADGILVLSHDNSIERCSNGTGNVSEMTYAELLEYDFGAWFSEEYAGTKIPTLTEFLETVKDMEQIHIELKGPVTASKVTAEVARLGLLDQVVFSSFYMEYLEDARAAQPDARLALIYGTGSEYIPALRKDPVGFCREHHLEALHGNMDTITSRMVKLCRENGIAVRAWTVNKQFRIAGCIGQGVDGIITDDVALTHTQLGKWMLWQRLAALWSNIVTDATYVLDFRL